jgi:hypothetical protein
MASEANIYRKFRGTGGGLFEYTSLYVAPDHLLQVISTGYSETYRRFYFRDIRAITVRKSAAGKITNGILGGLTLLFLIIGLQAGGGALIGWSVPGAFFSLLLAINFLRGPTCVCQIQTAVQTRKLGSLKRLRRARKFLDQLRPQIEAAQGALSPEEVARRIEQLRQGGFYTEEAAPVIEPAARETPEGFR